MHSRVELKGHRNDEYGIHADEKKIQKVFAAHSSSTRKMSLFWPEHSFQMS